ncbi:Response regulator containing CheY-like receiver domain and AraC-type DNA-binding domain [Paenibacillus sp. UNCCL117]|uniref:response regulator n=1 Tax=unclassified Paenibacillus TaxID=185978 RepID=UPI00088720DE|nr:MULTISPECIES: response regulator [unclassified Paenibacillus]SDD96376.1 Helix-turn-helix domain-containing protein [Paenibacillus sp. cl123]SFW56404.1 Response regulator containing CheY-like receiver domain and AraC-type DNA-binding domain [Paenibacillus sp. UNCCL117]
MEILIVEDETMIRNGLERMVGDLGYNVAASVDDGETALEWLKQCGSPPDLIITDIFMKYVDGMELVGKVNAEYPGVKCALLSGHDDFRLAQQAISLKVCRYLTKPVTREELDEALREIRSEVEQDKLRKKDLLKWEQRSASSALYIRDKLLSDLLESRLVSARDLLQHADCFDFDLEATSLSGGVIRLLSAGESMSQRDSLLYSVAVKHLFTETVMAEYRGFVLLKDSCTLVFGVMETQPERVRESVARFAGTSASMLGVPVEFGISAHAVNLLQFRQTVAAAFEDMERSGQEQRLYPSELEQKLRFSVRAGDRDAARADAKAVVGAIAASSAHADFLLRSFYRLTESLEDLFRELEQPVSPPLLAGLPRSGLIERMHEWLEECIARVEPKRQGQQNDIIAKVITHMEEYYADGSLSLQRLADLVYVHPNYLTQTFRKLTGFSCMQYLARLRMEQAKKLLNESDLKISEIAEKVGYDNHLYFSSYFKKWIGKSPSVYKEGLSSHD